MTRSADRRCSDSCSSWMVPGARHIRQPVPITSRAAWSVSSIPQLIVLPTLTMGLAAPAVLAAPSPAIVALTQTTPVIRRSGSPKNSLEPTLRSITNCSTTFAGSYLTRDWVAWMTPGTGTVVAWFSTTATITCGDRAALTTTVMCGLLKPGFRQRTPRWTRPTLSSKTVMATTRWIG